MGPAGSGVTITDAVWQDDEQFLVQFGENSYLIGATGGCVKARDGCLSRSFHHEEADREFPSRFRTLPALSDARQSPLP